MSRLFSFVACMLFALPAYALDPAYELPGDKVLGSKSAPLTVIEYASLSCGHCARFHNEVLPILEKEYVKPGKVRIIFRDFPLNAPALAAATMGECMNMQAGEKFFAVRKAMFAEQSQWAFEKDFQDRLMKIAKKAGADEKRLKTCIADKQIEAKILSGRKDAEEKLDVKQTPAFIIQGRLVPYLRDIEQFRRAFDEALKKKPAREEAPKAKK